MKGLIGLNTIEESIQATRIALTNARLPEIAPHLSLFGIGEEELSEGDQRLMTLDTTVRDHAKEYGEQYAATEQYTNKFKIANQVYMKSLKIARIVFVDDTATLVELDINGRRKRSFTGWYTQARKFYMGMNDERITAMSRYGITREILTAEQAQVEAVAIADISQAKERGEAQEATKIRDEAFDLLGDWMHIFKQIAHIALEDQPQAREKLGFLERS